MADDRQALAARLWLMSGTIPAGPFGPLEIHGKLAAGEVTWETLACPVGGKDWLPLVHVPGFGPVALTPVSEAALAVTPQPSHEATTRRLPAAQPTVVAAPPQPFTPHLPQPWNPLLIAWLGVLFSPPWAGVMAALNGKRLHVTLPWWMPLTIGFGSLAAAFAVSLVVDFYIVDVALYLGALGLLWHHVLRHQLPSFTAYQSDQHGAGGRWAWPAVAGSPIALLVVFKFMIAPLIPLEPRQVCERFSDATTADEASKYTTQNLRRGRL